MKNTLIALLGACALSPALHAESSAQIFGVVDLRLSHISNAGAGSVTALNSAGITTSMWGVRGKEDLGGGMYAGFWLEAILKPDSGDTGPGFNRRTTVSIGGRFGELRLGRDVTPSYRLVTQFDPFLANGLGADINVLSAGPAVNNAPANLRVSNYNQTSNAVVYVLPGAEGGAGVYGEAMYALGEGQTSNRYVGAHLGYRRGPLNVAGHVAQTNPASGVPQRHRTTGVAAAYALPTGTTVMAMYTRESTHRTASVDYQEPWWLVGAIHRIGAGEIHVSYVRRNATGTAAESANDVSLMALGYVYNLSRRTAVYTIAARLRNTGTGTVVIPNGVKTISPGGASSGFDVGIRHRF